MLDGFDDKFIIAGQVEERTAGARVRQLDQRLLTDRILEKTKIISISHPNAKRSTSHKRLKGNEILINITTLTKMFLKFTVVYIGLYNSLLYVLKD